MKITLNPNAEAVRTVRGVNGGAAIVIASESAQSKPNVCVRSSGES